jgi:hypothetical protein
VKKALVIHQEELIVKYVLLHASIVFLAFTVLSVAAQRPASTLPAGPIPLDEVHARGIEGKLGLRLGTVIEVSGEVITNSSQAKMNMDQPFFLRIDRVGDKALAQPAIFRARDMDLQEARPELKIGDHFHCAGYETGSFHGSPNGEFKYVKPYATVGYGFGTQFIILSPK